MSRSAPKSREFKMEIDIAAPREAVWNAIVNEADRWFAPDVRVEPGVGGEVVWSWKELHVWPQRIEVWEPGSRLRTRYDSSVEGTEGGHHPLFIDFQLEGEGGRTTLRLVHSGFGPAAAFDDEFDGISQGWPIELRSLRLYLERHAGEDRQLAWSTATIELAHDEAWRRLTGDDGLACGARIDGLREGDAFSLGTATGDVFEGDVLSCNRHGFTGVARNHGDGFFRFAVENCGGRSQVWLWLATYGQPAGAAEDLEARWDAMLERLFQAQGEAAGSRGA